MDIEYTPNKLKCIEQVPNREEARVIRAEEF